MATEMTLTEGLLHTAVRLVGQTKSGLSIGTGVLYGFHNRVFVVTNRHVVDGVNRCTFSLPEADQTGGIKPGQHVEITVDSGFVSHPDPEIDLAVTNVSLALNSLASQGHPAFYRTVADGHLLTQEFTEEYVSPVDDVLVIGYPQGLWDSVNLLPIARRGVTATPCYVDFQGKPVFLVDAPIFPGSSGSPVFLFHLGTYSNRAGTNVKLGSFVRFLGLIASVYTVTTRGKIEYIDIPTVTSAVPTSEQAMHLAVAFKAKSVVETMAHHLDRAAPGWRSEGTTGQQAPV